MQMDLRLGDSLEVLKKLPDSSVDSLVTDPPAGISFMGKEWDSNKGGRDQWIAWLTEVMRECYRVLKPGAHGLVWAIPRTSHWTATALENAGFEVRDVVTHLFGTGFPKSLDISKAIDKAAGAERQMIGWNPTARISVSSDERNLAQGKRSKEYGAETGCPITAPATDAAKQWSGWGTALKPASEHWILIRKPLSEKTVAKNVLKYGCGGLNIDASRISATDQEKFAKNWDRDKLCDMRGGNYGNGENSGVENNYSAPLGRFPANVVLSHNEDCVEVGVKEIKTDSHKADVTIGFGKRPYNGKEREPERKYTETVAAWECSEGCAVAELDRQSGILKNGGQNKTSKKGDGMFMDGCLEKGASNFAGDSGGASRFFYCAKASKADRNAGLDLLEEKRSETSKAGNHHPTVKSTKLMEYLIRLVTPPGGIVLDPFMGSGSTGVAAKRLGFGFIGIELNSDYIEIAKRRIENA